MKAKIERLMPKIFEKYAGPDVVVGLPGAKPETIEKFELPLRIVQKRVFGCFMGSKMPTLMRCRLTQEPKVSPITLITWSTSSTSAVRRLCPGCLVLLASLRLQLVQL